MHIPCALKYLRKVQILKTKVAISDVTKQNLMGKTKIGKLNKTKYSKINLNATAGYFFFENLYNVYSCGEEKLFHFIAIKH